MQITIEPTPNLIRLNNCIYRIWSGKTDKGTEIYAIVAAIAVDGELAPDEELELKLIEITEEQIKCQGVKN